MNHLINFTALLFSFFIMFEQVCSMYYLLQSYTDCKSQTMFSIFLSAVISLFVSFSAINCHVIDIGLTDLSKPGWAIAHSALSPTNLNAHNLTREERGTKQTVWCFEQFDGYGQSLKIQNPIKDLADYGWHNKISSCQFTGFWLLYENRNYNKHYPNVSTVAAHLRATAILNSALNSMRLLTQSGS